MKIMLLYTSYEQLFSVSFVNSVGLSLWCYRRLYKPSSYLSFFN